MKNIFNILLMFLSLSFAVKGQSDTISCNLEIDTLTGTDIYTYIDIEPSPTGGQKQLTEELIKLNLRGKCLNIDSRLVVAFIVDVEGKIIGKRVVKDIEGTDFAEQVLKLIDNIEWMPGICDDIAVPAIRMVYVRICL